MLETILSKIWPYIVGAIGVFGVYLFGRRDGTNKIEKQQLEQTAAHDRRAGEIASEVRNEIKNLTPDDIDRELLDKWVRPIPKK